jgi:hypothetical protein
MEDCNMKDCNMRNYQRKEHKISDFLWSVTIGGVPEVVAIMAIANESPVWLLAYIPFLFVFALAEVRFLCRHCHYYGQQQGIMVKCKSMWGPFKLFKPSPGPLGRFDTVMLYLSFVIGFAFPLYWLAHQPQLLVIYIWSLVILVVTMEKYECHRCMMFHCPFNRVSKEIKDDLRERGCGGVSCGGRS